MELFFKTFQFSQNHKTWICISLSSNNFVWLLLIKNIICLQVGDDGNICTSLIQFTPGKEDDQKFLSCQGRNEMIEDSGVEDQWKITVYCKLNLIFKILFVKCETMNELNNHLKKLEISRANKTFWQVCWHSKECLAKILLRFSQFRKNIFSWNKS